MQNLQIARQDLEPFRRARGLWTVAAAIPLREEYSICFRKARNSKFTRLGNAYPGKMHFAISNVGNTLLVRGQAVNTVEEARAILARTGHSCTELIRTLRERRLEEGYLIQLVYTKRVEAEFRYLEEMEGDEGRAA